MTDHQTSRRGLFKLAGSAAIASLLVGCGGSAVAAGPFEVRKSDAEWKKLLGPQRYRILREAGTETPYTSPLNKEQRRGTFACAGCALPLFASATKFDSGTGWPSFYAPLPKAIAETRDVSLGMVRREVHCRRCGGHQGHVFEDGPKPTGLRYCINGLSLQFRPA